MLEGTVPDGREIAVIGLGRSGEAATRLLRQAGLPVYASDAGRSEALEATARELASLGGAVDLGGHDLERIGRAALCIVSPGVPPEASPLVAARRSGVPIRAEADLGLEALAGIPYIAVTGTNGKSTTTALIGHLLLAGGRRALAVGNIGTPLSEIAMLPVRPEWLAVELSSFQLHDLAELRPAVGVLTNLSPDHLDRYARLEDYYDDKKRMFLNAGPDSLWVINADDPASRELVREVPGRQLDFSVRERAEAWFDRKTRTLRLGGEELLPRDEISLLGDHNVANALAASVAVHATGVGIPALADGLRTFRALQHRMEPVREVGGVLWINDSKATNIASTEVAVAALERPFVLLLGGRHKGEPYTRLAPRLAGRCRVVVAFGEAKPIVLRDLAGTGIPLVEAGSFDQVMAVAQRLAQPGDAVLLSPACSSYDMFTNYVERGRRFREIVEGW
jgi:UDP-N-acetylmuramoylalanine--D-glutamate ligase